MLAFRLPTGTQLSAVTIRPCRQCEETLGGAGCESIGVCGKTADVAALQDLLMYQMKGIGAYADLLRRKAGHFDAGLARFTKECVFATLTNTNFDSMNLMDKIMLSDKYLDKLRSLSSESQPQSLSISSLCSLGPSAPRQPPLAP